MWGPERKTSEPYLAIHVRSDEIASEAYQTVLVRSDEIASEAYLTFK